MTATVTSIANSAGRTPSLDPIMALVAGDMAQVNQVILDRMQSEIPLIPSSPDISSRAAASGCGRC